MMYPTLADSLELASILYGIDTDELADALAYGVASDSLLGGDDFSLPEAYGYASAGRLAEMMASAERADASFDSAALKSDPMATGSHSFDYSQSDYVGAF